MNTITFRYHHKGSQSGAALITALVFLVIMTMLAVTSLTTATLEERMAANSQETNRVFQAAETGLARAYNDNAAFNTSNTAANPYAPPADTIGQGYAATLAYRAIFIQATRPPRLAMFEVGRARAYHFDLAARASTPAATTTLHQGAFQIGPAPVD